MGPDAPEAREASRQAESRYRTLIEWVPAVTYVWDSSAPSPKDAAVYTSPQVEALLGYTADEWNGMPSAWESCVHPDDLPDVMAAWSLARNRNKPFRAEYRMRRRDGSIVWVRDEAQQVSRGPRGLPTWQGVMFDITDRLKAEESSKMYAERLRILHRVDQATLSGSSAEEVAQIATDEIRGLVGCSRVSVVEFDSEADTVEVIGVSTDYETKVSPRSVWPRAAFPDPPEFQQGLPLVRPIEEVHEMVQNTAAANALAAEGIARMAFMPLIAEGEVIGCLTMSGTETQAFTEEHVEAGSEVAGELAVSLRQARLQEQVRAYASELEQRLGELRTTDEERRKLLARLVRAQEEERRRIASDIHDDSIQKVASVGLRLEGLKRHLRSDDAATRSLLSLEETIRGAIERLRRMVFELWPQSLDRHGLHAAVKTDLEQTRNETGLDFKLENGLVGDVPMSSRTIAYRIFREALTNVVNHAEARTVEVALATRDGGVWGRIKDDGKGFDRTVDPPPGHLGLSAMRERAQMGNGWLRVESSPGAGTSVEFWLPAGDDEPAEDEP